MAGKTSGLGAMVPMGKMEAERIVWEALLEMGRFDCRAGGTDQGAITLVLDLDEGFGQVRLPVVLGRR